MGRSCPVNCDSSNKSQSNCVVVLRYAFHSRLTFHSRMYEVGRNLVLQLRLYELGKQSRNATVSGGERCVAV